MAKVYDFPKELMNALTNALIKFTLIKGDIFYHSPNGYNAAQKIIKKLEKENPKQGYVKYNNKKVKLILDLAGGSNQFFDTNIIPTPVIFDSENECDYYYHLLDLKEAGIVTKIELHPKLILIPAFVGIDGKTQAALTYSPDFYVEFSNDKKAYIDIKGMSTQQGDLRRKIYDYLAMRPPAKWFGIPLWWIASNFKHAAPGADGWINYDELQVKLATQRKNKKAQEAKQHAAL